jgi:hypothetical protein
MPIGEEAAMQVAEAAANVDVRLHETKRTDPLERDRH